METSEDRRPLRGSDSTPPITAGQAVSNEITKRESPHLLANPTALRAAREYRRWQDELGDFLTHFDWQLYATPTFRFPVTFPQAKSAVETWIAAFGPQAFAYAAYERGQAGGRTHCHVLLGGLIGEIARTHAGRLWSHGVSVAARRRGVGQGREAVGWPVASVPPEVGHRAQTPPRRGRGRDRRVVRPQLVEDCVPAGRPRDDVSSGQRAPEAQRGSAWKVTTSSNRR